MKNLFSNDSLDIFLKCEINNKVQNQINQIETKRFYSDGLILLQNEIFNSNKFEPLDFDINMAKFSMKTGLVPKSFLSPGHDYQDGIFHKILCSIILNNGTKELLYIKPIDFAANNYFEGYVTQKNEILVERPTDLWNENEINRDDEVKLVRYKEELKDYLEKGKNLINNEIPVKNIELQNNIVALLKIKMEKINKDKGLDDLLNN